MQTEQMIKELRRLEEKHKNDNVGFGENNWSAMCHDVAKRLEEQQLNFTEVEKWHRFIKSNTAELHM